MNRFYHTRVKKISRGWMFSVVQNTLMPKTGGGYECHRISVKTGVATSSACAQDAAEFFKRMIKGA